MKTVQISRWSETEFPLAFIHLCWKTSPYTTASWRVFNILSGIALDSHTKPTGVSCIYITSSSQKGTYACGGEDATYTFAGSAKVIFPS